MTPRRAAIRTPSYSPGFSRGERNTPHGDAFEGVTVARRVGWKRKRRLSERSKAARPLRRVAIRRLRFRLTVGATHRVMRVRSSAPAKAGAMYRVASFDPTPLAAARRPQALPPSRVCRHHARSAVTLGASSRQGGAPRVRHPNAPPFRAGAPKPASHSAG